MARISRVDAKTVTEDKLVPKLAAKVQLLSIDRRTAEHIKRSAAESLVRRLLAVQIARYIYQRVAVRPATTARPPSDTRATDITPTFWEIDKRLGLKEQMPERKVYKPWEIAVW